MNYQLAQEIATILEESNWDEKIYEHPKIKSYIITKDEFFIVPALFNEYDSEIWMSKGKIMLYCLIMGNEELIKLDKNDVEIL